MMQLCRHVMLSKVSLIQLRMLAFIASHLRLPNIINFNRLITIQKLETNAETCAQDI